MALLSKTLRLTRARRLAANRLSEARGNVLIYVVLVMVIFGFLGVTMVSLFSTSISSSSTRNDTRRAFYMAESGIRYGVSQLRDKDFKSKDIDDLNTTTYKLKLPPLGEFAINVFGPWFESPSDQSLSGSGLLNLKVTEGKIPSDFLSQIPTAAPYIWLVNRDYINFDKDNPNMRFRPTETGIAEVRGAPLGSETTFQLNLNDDFVSAKGEELCLAAPPAAAGQDVTVGGNFTLSTAARGIFPKLGGAFEIRKRNFSYREAREISGGIQLINIQPVSGETSVMESNIQTDEGIILTSRNHMVTAEGKYGDVVYPATASFAAAIADRSVVKAKSRKPDIAFEDDQNLPEAFNPLREQTGFITLSPGSADKNIKIGGVSNSFGSVWFKANRNIGGIKDFCGSRGCLFNEGIRVFFTLEYSGTGPGLIFSLTNGAENDADSAGGDIASSELLGYAGDSRTNLAGTSFLDNSGARGLLPPKMGLEFDTKINYDSDFEKKPGDFCGNGALKTNTRNDPDTDSNPLTDQKDSIQYVFWGNASLNVSCRDNNPSYDDNRHDATGTTSGDWFRSLSGVINTSAVVTNDGKTIYIGSNNSDINPTTGRLYAFELDADGIPKPGGETPFFTATSITTPVLGKDGTTVYVGADNALYAFAGKSLKPGFSTVTTPGTVTQPAVGRDGTIYIVSNVAPNFGYVYAIDPSSGSLKSDWAINPQVILSGAPAPYVLSPVVYKGASLGDSRVYVAAREGTIYAFRADNGSVSWQKKPGGAINTPVGVGPDGTVYVGTNDKKIYALAQSNPTPPLWDSKIPELEAISTILEDFSSSPTVGSNGRLYIGNYNDYLYAIRTADGKPEWAYRAAGNVQSTPSLDSNNNIYFGSDIRNFFDDHRNVYALFADGNEKWRFETGGDVRGTPAVQADGTVYVGSFDSNFYAINQFASPKNFRNLRITSSSATKLVGIDRNGQGADYNGDGNAEQLAVALDSEDDWLNGSTARGPWAVRMEITRDPGTPGGPGEYTLRTWLRQCDKTLTDTCTNIFGTFYEDTRVNYPTAIRPPLLVQTIKLDASEHLLFNRFIFGFTSAAGSGENGTATIRKFQLSFIRPNDPTAEDIPLLLPSPLP